MQVPTIKLSEASQATAEKIIKASRKKTTFGQQTVMANYYAFLHSEKQVAEDVKNYARILLG